MDDMRALAELSHRVEGAALVLATAGHRADRIAHELGALSDGQREVLAVALSYLLRRRSLAADSDAASLGDAIDAVVLTLRRTP